MVAADVNLGIIVVGILLELQFEFAFGRALRGRFARRFLIVFVRVGHHRLPSLLVLATSAADARSRPTLVPAARPISSTGDKLFDRGRRAFCQAPLAQLHSDRTTPTTGR